MRFAHLPVKHTPKFTKLSVNVTRDRDSASFDGTVLYGTDDKDPVLMASPI